LEISLAICVPTISGSPSLAICPGYLRCPPVPLRSALTALLLAPLVPLHSADDLPEPPVSWKYPPEMPGANVEVYRDVNGIKLNAYIFTPPNHQVSDHRPAVLFFFGGGWKGGTPGQFLPQSLYLARRGMVAIPCDYRVSSRHNAIP